MTSPSLDKNKNNCINPCGYKTMTGVIEGVSTVRHVTARMYCKRWSCTYCGPRRAWMYQQLIAERAIDFKLDRFMTLTLDPKKIKGDPYKHLNESWRKLREAFRRKFGKSVSYIAITEEHKSGIPHKHILVDHYIHQKWLSSKWDKLGGGRMVDIRKIKDIQNMARYVGKYLTKDVLLSCPKGTRRVTTSQNIKLRKKSSEGSWTVSDVNMEKLLEHQKHRAENIVMEKSGRLKSFETSRPIDLTPWGVPNDRPAIQEGDRALFPELPEEHWELIATFERDDLKYETGSSIRKSIQPGTTLGRLFHSRTTQALGGLCPRTWIPDCTSLRGSRNGKKGRTSGLRRHAYVSQEVFCLQNHSG